MSARYDDRTLGELLYETRRQLGVSIDEVSSITHIAPAVIEAFENDDYDAMPPRGYAQNMLGAYSNFLGLERSKTSALYQRGFDDAAEGYRYENADRYRQGRPIDVSRSDFVDPLKPRHQLDPSRPSVSGNRRGKGRTGEFKPVPYDEYAEGSRDVRVSRSGRNRRDDRDRRDDSDRPRRTDRTLRQQPPQQQRRRSSLERPGIDDDRSPRAVSRMTGFSDVRGNRRGDDRRQAREQRQSGRRVHEDRRRDSNRLGSFEDDHMLSRRRRPGVDDTRRQQGGRGGLFGLLAMINPRMLAVVAVVVIILAIAIGLIVSANKKDDSTATVPVADTTQSQTVAAQGGGDNGAGQGAAGGTDTSTTENAQGATTQTGTTTAVAGDQDSAAVSFSIADGATSNVSVTVDGRESFSGMAIGPITQSFTVTKSCTMTFSSTEGVTVERDDTPIDLEPDGNGGGTVTMNIAD